jgi:phosphatidylinositol alpha-1,6-mannosyltransferase
LVNGLITDELCGIRVDSMSAFKLKGSPRLLTVGQLTRRKGQHRVINALPYLRKQWPDIHYHMVGLDTDRDRLMEQANGLGVTDCITIHGRVSEREDLFKFYTSVDVFIMLSESQADGDVEGFGIAILEANYFGVPAVGASGCGIEAAIKDGENGFLVDGDKVKQITEAIDSCLRKSEDMKPAMKEWVKQHNWDDLISQFLR